MLAGLNRGGLKQMGAEKCDQQAYNSSIQHEITALPDQNQSVLIQEFKILFASVLPGRLKLL